ncbi:MAG: hypothetical protein OEY23_15915, partial [Acidimicrobiia bacterium]|nr:hypothetical protein [Acidimicrobiia bacterium]
MTPTLIGRIQTRLFLLALVGLPWTLLVTPLLPRDGSADGGVGSLYGMTLVALFEVALLGVIVWEPIYHLAQQFRWEKDWPIMFALLVGIPEAVLVWLALPRSEGSPATVATYVAHFATT